MRSAFAIAISVALLVAVPGAGAQTGNPFGPLTPQPPPPGPQQPGQQTAPQPAPQTVPPREASDEEFSLLEWSAFGGVAVLLVGGVAVAIARDGRPLRARLRRGRRTARVTADPRRRAADAARSSARSSGRRSGVKAPPPPPRKRRSNHKRRVKARRH